MESVPSAEGEFNFESANVGAGSTYDDPYQIGPFGTTNVDDIPEAYKGETPTVKVFPPKDLKKTLPPEYKTNKLPPKEVTNKKKPLFPPGTEPFDSPNF